MIFLHHCVFFSKKNFDQMCEELLVIDDYRVINNQISPSASVTYSSNNRQNRHFLYSICPLKFHQHVLGQLIFQIIVVSSLDILLCDQFPSYRFFFAQLCNLVCPDAMSAFLTSLPIVARTISILRRISRLQSNTIK